MSKKQLLALTIRKVVLSLIGIGVIAAMFWYVNTYIYKFYAGSAVVKVDSSSTVSEVEQGKELSVQFILSGQKIETADLYINFSNEQLQYLDKVVTVPANYFKLPPDYSRVSAIPSNSVIIKPSQLRLILLAASNVKAANSVQVNLTFKAIKSGEAVVTIDPKSVISGVDGSNNAVSFDEDLAKATKKITVKSPDVPNKPPTITKVTWSATKLIAGKKGSVTVTGTDPDDAKVSVSVVATANNQTEYTVIEKKDITVTNGQWTANLESTVPGILGSVKAFVVATDGPNSIKDAGTNLTIAADTSDCKPQITKPANNSVAPELVNGQKQLEVVWNKCSGISFYKATITGPGIPVDQLPYYFVDNSTSVTSIPRLLDIASSMEIGGKYTMKVASCSEDGCTNPVIAESEPISFYYAAEPSEETLPPWENQDYSKTVVWGVVQTEDEDSNQLNYWRENNTVCEGSDYPVADMLIDPPNTAIKNCYESGSTQLPYFYAEVDNPGNNLAYTLKNLPPGYTCSGWEHRLRVKSDGAVTVEKTGTGCTTGPLEITIQDETSSYNNAHFLLFKIRKSPEAPTPAEQFDTTAYMTVRFQGITELPPEPYRTLNAKVTLLKNDNEIVTKDVEFKGNTDGTWTGSMGVDGLTRGSKYSIKIKGAKHLSKTICDNNPSEQLSGTYKCEGDAITLDNVINILDFSKIVLLGGDLPQQDGIINALDYVFVRQNLGNREEQNLIRGDLNLDGIIDSQDNTIIVTALGFKYDED